MSDEGMSTEAWAQWIREAQERIDRFTATEDHREKGWHLLAIDAADGLELSWQPPEVIKREVLRLNEPEDMGRLDRAFEGIRGKPGVALLVVIHRSGDVGIFGATPEG